MLFIEITEWKRKFFITCFVLTVDKGGTTAFDMYPQELTLGLEKPRRVKETFSTPFIVPLPPTPQISALLFSHLPYEHFYLNLLLVAFITATTGPSRASCFPDRWMWKMRILETSATYVASDFFYYIGNIYVHILNFIYVITEHYVPCVCVDSALTGLYAVINGPIVCSDLIPGWELASLLPHANYLPLLLCVRKHSVRLCQWMDAAKSTLERDNRFLKNLAYGKNSHVPGGSSLS